MDEKAASEEAYPADGAFSTDEIRLGGLRLRTTLGVYEAERLAPREVVADLRLAVDLRPAGRSDDLRDTMDYAALAERLRAVADGARFRLLEALAEALAAEALADPRVRGVDLVLAKPGAVPGAEVSVRVRRRREG